MLSLTPLRLPVLLPKDSQDHFPTEFLPQKVPFSLQTPEYTGSGTVSGQNKHLWFALYRRKLQITGQFIIGAGGHLIQFRNVTFRENLLRCSEAVHPVAADTGNLIGNPSCQIQFMKGHDDRQFSCPGHILYNGKKFQLIADVQKRSRFIPGR